VNHATIGEVANGKSRAEIRRHRSLVTIPRESKPLWKWDGISR